MSSTSYGKKREPRMISVVVCAGCGKSTGTFVAIHKLLVHDNPSCRQLKWAANREKEPVEA